MTVLPKVPSLGPLKQPW